MNPLILLSFVSLSLAANCPSDTTYFSITNRCYKFVTAPMGYAGAQQFCQDNGGLIVPLINETENEFLAETAMSRFGANASSYWIGLDSLNGFWRWDDGRNLTWQNWAKGQPGNTTYTCAYSGLPVATWGSCPCYQNRLSICAFTANPTTVAPPTPTPGPKCAILQTYFDTTNMCYSVGSSAEFWSAESACNMEGGHLASIHNAYENTFISGLTATNASQNAYGMTWIGLHYASDAWIWTDGSNNDFQNFRTDEGLGSTSKYPCIEMLQDVYNSIHGQIGKWNSQPCNYMMRKFVCKIKPLW